MTLNKLKIAVSQALFEEFGEAYTIYTEQKQQGFKVPCFYIKLIEPSQEQGFDRSNKRFNKFDIHFFPEEDSYKNTSMNDVYDRLLEALEYIEVEGKLYRGLKMRGNPHDGVLHFFVDFDFHVIKPKNKNYMDYLIQKGATK